MPRHKRHKKHVKGRNKAFKNKTVRTNNTASINFDNSFKENVLSEVSHVQTPSNRKTFVDNINMTPVNSRGSINRDRKLNYESMNVTNLNILFNSNQSYNTPKSAKEICINHSNNIAYEIRANSNLPKPFSPNTDKLLSLNQKVNSNRIIESEPIIKRCNEIPQTPKMTKVQLLQERLLEKSCAVPNNILKNDQNCSNKLFGNEVNINPYLKNKETNKVSNTSFGELAFFSPKYFQHKSSTPIAKIHNQNKVDNVNDCSFNIAKVDASELFLSPRTPNLHLNLNYNNVTLSDKVQNKNDSLRSLKNIAHISKKHNFLHSLESLENVPQLKVCDKSQQYSYSKINTSKRSSLHDVSCENVCKPEVIAKIFHWLKKCYRVFVNFPSNFKQACSHFGVQVKSSMTSLYKIYNRNSRPVLDTTNKQPCKCQQYCRDISSLNENIVELKKTVEHLKMQIESYHSSRENFLILSEELKKAKEEVMQFADIRSEIQSLKGQVSSLQTASIIRTISNAGSQMYSAPPPPPPPPPLPPMNLSEIPINKLKLTRTSKSHSLDKGSCRPVISLDDILKVKLKKASERAYQTPVNCHKGQPVVSIDMLQQVKLRPASRTSLRSETIESTLDSTSPHSSLARLLKTDSPAARLKRLRKVSGYSHDSLYRRNLLKRERDNS